MDLSTVFDDLGTNAVVATQFMDWLGLNSTDFYDPIRFERFKSVVAYLKQFPEDTQRFLISKTTRGKMVDKLDQVFEYTLLLKQKYAQEQNIENLEKELSVLEATQDPKLEMVAFQRNSMKNELSKLMEEIQIYEK